ncbi:MAG TPA: hypothetical protein PKA10_13335 [Selenomonadales bacterium]|nr:hypothetical protein [Selenomonadales bacterium]
MELKSSFKSASTQHLYEFAEEIGNLGSAIDANNYFAGSAAFPTAAPLTAGHGGMSMQQEIPWLFNETFDPDRFTEDAELQEPDSEPENESSFQDSMIFPI